MVNASINNQLRNQSLETTNKELKKKYERNKTLGWKE